MREGSKFYISIGSNKSSNKVGTPNFRQIKQSQFIKEPKNKNLQHLVENVNISSSFGSEDLTDDKQSNPEIVVKGTPIIFSFTLSVSVRNKFVFVTKSFTPCLLGCLKPFLADDVVQNSSQFEFEGEGGNVSVKQISHKNLSHAKPIMRKNSNDSLKPPINFQRIGSMFEK